MLGSLAIAMSSTSRSRSSREQPLASSKDRRHELSGNATALVPQGLCHYFINLTLDPMAMIWVYAGDKPDRIVMDESYCHPEKAKKMSEAGATAGILQWPVLAGFDRIRLQELIGLYRPMSLPQSARPPCQ